MSILNELPLNRYPTEHFSARVGIDSAFSVATARALCWVSQLAYESDAKKIGIIVARWGFSESRRFDRRIWAPLPTTDTKGLVLTGDHAVILAFAGTDPLSFANWITDFDWVPKCGDLHTGFRMAVDVAWNDSREAAQRAAQEGLRLYITGHSLGAALAALTANRLQSELGIVADAVYAFGMPRAGGPGLVAEYGVNLGMRTFRFVHGSDIVPTVPPPQLGFQHVGRPLFCGRYDKFTPPPSDDCSSNAPLPADAALTTLREEIGNLLRGGIVIDAYAKANDLVFPALPLMVSDHLPDRYLLALS
jgi:triacylglycerol lipase